MNEGVEWGVHSCLNLAWVGAESAVSSARLAEYYGLPPGYMNKQLQALARAGIVYSTPGPGGGFRLARAPAEITVMDVVAAIEGREPAFRCAEIRQRGPGADDVAPVDPCQVDQVMRRAELAWRAELARRTLADIKAAVEASSPEVPVRTRRWFAGP
ncbi:Rrf2 family transcriptional regulator [Spiractinospora alimapuensis]|uniref:RrF2 family transcriptional regulator n=1 Tax=Spiractinospora alimapuensis TaxID=2820884 RepID=UPI001F1BE119|nr:Rrf2 family transcriptional regulator [Spiractinospora alimapuensis]QVQ53809.1 Rrf2 family transcriptional regulator [Spiractinospora alimapuensis]